MKPKKIGQGFDLDDFEQVLKKEKPKLMYVCHGDSSTGVLQQLDWTGNNNNGQDKAGQTLGQVCHKHNCLLLVDAVASLLSTPLNVDALKIDIAFSGSQKCLSAPPGLALITLSDRAMELIRGRRSPVVSYYLDIMKMTSSWAIPAQPGGQLKGQPTFAYHSTHAVSLLIGLREAISVVSEIGLKEVIQKHQGTSR